MENKPDPRLSSAVLRIFLLIGLVIILYYGAGILIPLATAGLLAMMLSPVQDKLMSWGLSAGFAIGGAVLLLLTFFAALVIAVGAQAVNLADNWGEIEKNVGKQVAQLRESVPLGHLIPTIGIGAAADSTSAGPSVSSEAASEKSGKEEEAKQVAGPGKQLPISRSGVMSFFSGTIGVLGDYLLMLVYIILFLNQKKQLRKFVLRLMPDEERGNTHRTINESMDIVQSYLRGQLILIAVLATLYSIGFLIIGLDYAVLLAVLAAVLSIIPYLGNIIGGLIAISVGIATGGGMTATLGILATMAVAQTMESYVLLPIVVGDEVNLNPLATIVCVIGMTVLWGPVGAIIAIPVFAIIRVVFSHVPGLEDYAYLLDAES